MFAGVSSAAFSTIGGAFTETSGFWAEGGLAHIGAHALTGGVMSVLQGGKFGHGFFSAGLTKAANVNSIFGTSADRRFLRIVSASIIGGTISKATGGKYANGAITAAFAQAFNGESAAKRAEAQKGYVFENDKLKNTVSRALHQSELTTEQFSQTHGIVIKNSGGDFLYDMSQPQTDIPEGFESRGVETKLKIFGIPFNTGTADARLNIDNAKALVVTQPRYTAIKDWNWLSSAQKVPVFVGQRGNSNTYVYTGKGDPQLVNFK